MRSTLLAALLALTPVSALAATCGGSFNAFKQGLIAEAPKHGVSADIATKFLAGVRADPAVLRADHSQGVFQRPFVDFSRRLISNDRISRGRANGQKYNSIFDRIKKNYGVDRGVLLAFWAGEIGMVQMLPRDIIENGTDGDGDGHVYLKTSAPDALMSGGKMLKSLGWRKGEPWIDEVIVPDDFDWSLTGLETTKRASDWAKLGVKPRDGRLANLPASLILPQGRKGPAFLTYPNFNVYFEWNQSFTYVLTAAYFATRLNGAQDYDAGNPEQGLSGNQMKRLQKALQKRGNDVGKVDGILGANTRKAVQREQQRLGVPADAWPTPALLSKLEGRQP